MCSRMVMAYKSVCTKCRLHCQSIQKQFYLTFYSTAEKKQMSEAIRIYSMLLLRIMAVKQYELYEEK